MGLDVVLGCGISSRKLFQSHIDIFLALGRLLVLPMRPSRSLAGVPGMELDPSAPRLGF